MNRWKSTKNDCFGSVSTIPNIDFLVNMTSGIAATLKAGDCQGESAVRNEFEIVGGLLSEKCDFVSGT